MNPYAAVAVINVAICATVGAGFYFTASAWPVIGLLFMVGLNNRKSQKEDAES